VRISPSPQKGKVSPIYTRKPKNSQLSFWKKDNLFPKKKKKKRNTGSLDTISTTQAFQ
jgi:hypothetical protein